MTPEEIKGLADSISLLSVQLESRPGEWFPVIAALGGALVGAMASFIPAYYLERHKERRHSHRILSSLLAEISALLLIIENRKYHASIKEIITYLETQPPETKHAFVIQVPEHYSRIYQENCSNIGLIDQEISEKIVAFHQLIDSIVQDVRRDSTTSSFGYLEVYKQIDNIFTQALAIGEELISAHNNRMQSDAAKLRR